MEKGEVGENQHIYNIIYIYIILKVFQEVLFMGESGERCFSDGFSPTGTLFGMVPP